MSASAPAASATPRAPGVTFGRWLLRQAAIVASGILVLLAILVVRASSRGGHAFVNEDPWRVWVPSPDSMQQIRHLAREPGGERVAVHGWVHAVPMNHDGKTYTWNRMYFSYVDDQGLVGARHHHRGDFLVCGPRVVAKDGTVWQEAWNAELDVYAWSGNVQQRKPAGYIARDLAGTWVLEGEELPAQCVLNASGSHDIGDTAQRWGSHDGILLVTWFHTTPPPKINGRARPAFPVQPRIVARLAEDRRSFEGVDGLGRPVKGKRAE